MTNDNKNYQDSDADGLSDEQEKSLGTNPLDPDSDHDGLDDYEEVNLYGTDPLNKDTDHDGFSDGEEVKMGRNPKGPGLLKDLFIPRAENNYQPKALHPHRLAFYAVSSLIIKFILVIFVILLPLSAWLTPDILKEESQKIITLTNQIRANQGVALLNESASLDTAAGYKAADMLEQQYFAHVGPDQKTVASWLAAVGYKYKYAGENLAMGFASAEDVVNAWTQSVTHYNNLIDPDFSETGVGMASGVYNDYDTTFVAQFFAAPKISISPAQTNQVTPPVELEAITPEPVVLEQAPAEEQEVLAQSIANQSPDLEVPLLLSPTNNFLTNSNSIELSILSPEAENIIIYLDNQKTISQEITGEQEVDFVLDVTEGDHTLVIESVLGEQNAYSKEYQLTVDQTPPQIDYDKSFVSFEPTSDANQQLINAVAYLSSDTKEATVIFGNYQINLNQDQTDQEKWSGQLTVFEENDASEINPLIMPNIIATDLAGNEAAYDINGLNITPVNPSLVSQYTFTKDHLPSFLQPLFTLGTMFYKIILVLAIVALLLNIFIEIKKQHPKIILSSLGLIGLLLVLILI